MHYKSNTRELADRNAPCHSKFFLYLMCLFAHLVCTIYTTWQGGQEYIVNTSSKPISANRFTALYTPFLAFRLNLQLGSKVVVYVAANIRNKMLRNLRHVARLSAPFYSSPSLETFWKTWCLIFPLEFFLFGTLQNILKSFSIRRFYENSNGNWAEVI